MALSGTSRGTGGNATSSTSLSISPTSNFTAGSAGVLFMVFDNSGSQGSDPLSGSFTRPSGTNFSIWFSSLNDPGAASAGSVLYGFVATSISSFTTSESLNFTFLTNTVAKAWVLLEITSNISGSGFEFTLGGLGVGYTTGNGTTQTWTRSVPSGSMAIGCLGQEGNGTRTGDSDTTNGSWSTAQSTGFGTTTGGQEIISQFKVVTATGNQTFNPVASPIGDWNICLGYCTELAPAEQFDPMGMMGFFGI